MDDDVVAGAKLILALSELTQAERHCVIGLHYRGLSRTQVAEERGTTRFAVDDTAKRGMRKLRVSLDPTDFGIAA